MSDIYFEVVSKLGKKIRITRGYWSFIVSLKHPEIEGLENEVKKALQTPDEIRISQEDVEIYLYYHRLNKYRLCVVARHLNDDGFIITSYITDKVKEGVQIWKK